MKVLLGVVSLPIALVLLVLTSEALAITPAPENDYGRSVSGGLDMPWKSLLQGEGMDGWRPLGSHRHDKPETMDEWSREGDAIISHLPENHRHTGILHGDASWKNYEYSVFATLEEGSAMQFPLRVSEDGEGFYFVEFDYAWQTINVTLREKEKKGVTKLSVVNFALEKGREYHLLIHTQDRSITTYIDGKLVNQVTDATYRNGAVGINMWWKTRARYRDPKIRFYQWP